MDSSPMYNVGFLYLIGAGLLSNGSWIVGVVPTLSFTVLVWMSCKMKKKMLCDFSPEYVSYIEKELDDSSQIFDCQ